MKPEMPRGSTRSQRCLEERSVSDLRFPSPECCLQSGFNFSRGYSSPFDDGNHRFHNLRRQYLTASAHEQKCELFVLTLIVLACAWPVISMVVTVVQLYSRQHP